MLLRKLLQSQMTLDTVAARCQQVDKEQFWRAPSLEPQCSTHMHELFCTKLTAWRRKATCMPHVCVYDIHAQGFRALAVSIEVGAVIGAGAGVGVRVAVLQHRLATILFV